MNTCFTIRRQSRHTKKFGQLASRPAPHQVHLEETLLCVCVAERPGRVMAILRADCHASQIVALDGYRGSEARGIHVAIVPGHAPTQCKPGSARHKRDERK